MPPPRWIIWTFSVTVLSAKEIHVFSSTAMTPIFWLGPDQPESNSGSPFYFLEALQAVLAAEGQPPARIVRYPRIRERLPSAFRWAVRRSSDPRTYALSPEYLDNLLAAKPVPAPSVWISRSQMMPVQLLQSDASGAKIGLYIDSTLPPLFENFADLRHMAPATRRHWLNREQASYRRADMIFCYHAQVQRQLVEQYGVAPAKTQVLGRGVNIPVGALDRQAKPGAAGRTLRLMFVGRDARRKGLFDLIAAIDSLPPSDRERIELVAIGPGRWQLPRRPFLKRIGYLRSDQRAELIEWMQSSDLGVLLSSAEGLPGFVWEMLYLGKPVLATRLAQYAEIPDGMPMIYVPLPLKVEDVARAIKLFLDGGDARPAAPLELRRSLSWQKQAEDVARWARNAFS